MSEDPEVDSRPISESQQETAPELSPFERIFEHYRLAITALREFSSHLSPVVTTLDEDAIEQRRAKMQGILSCASPEALEELKRLVEWVRSGGQNEFEVRDLEGALLIADVFETIGHHIPPRHHELLNRSILMSLVGYFEVLISDLAHSYYQVVPDATSNDDKVLSVNELKSFSSIGEAIENVVDQKVDDLLRGSMEDWHKFFQTRMKIDLTTITPSWPQWIEMFQRRHIIVHAGGKATRRYVDKVDWSAVSWPPKRPSVGDEVPVDDPYLEGALGIFEIAGLLLCQEVWKKLAPQEHDLRLQLRLLGNAVYPRLLSRHWYVAEHLSAWGEKDSSGDEATRLTFTFNRWLSIKRQGRWGEVEAEVRAFDCSAKDPKFAIARASLLEDPDQFFALAPAAVAAGVSTENLKEWPILEEIRGDERFTKLIETG